MFAESEGEKQEEGLTGHSEETGKRRMCLSW